MESPTYVAFATQKGGVGKSTLTTLRRELPLLRRGVELVAVDCDSSQHSMNVYRDHDLVVTKENPYLKRALHRFYLGFEKKPYEIILTSPKKMPWMLLTTMLTTRRRKRSRPWCSSTSPEQSIIRALLT